MADCHTVGVRERETLLRGEGHGHEWHRGMRRPCIGKTQRQQEMHRLAGGLECKRNLKIKNNSFKEENQACTFSMKSLLWAAILNSVESNTMVYSLHC